MAEDSDEFEEDEEDYDPANVRNFEQNFETITIFRRFLLTLAYSALLHQLPLTTIFCTCPKIMDFSFRTRIIAATLRAQSIIWVRVSALDSLSNYFVLGLKVGAGNFCIKCPSKRFNDLNSCQLHMRDKAHCQYSVEGDLVVEYLDFYDYG